MAVTKATSAPKPPPRAITPAKSGSSTQQGTSSTTSGSTSNPASSPTRAPGALGSRSLEQIRQALDTSLRQDRVANKEMSDSERSNLRAATRNLPTTGATRAPDDGSPPPVGLTKGIQSNNSGATQAPAAQPPAGSAEAAATAAPATAAAQGASAVDFSKMTQAQQYDYLKDLTIQQAGGNENAWKSGANEVNLVGIRSFQNGKAVAAEGDKYNDTIYGCRMRNGQKEVQAFNSTTDAGIWQDAASKGMSFIDRRGNDRGVTHLADGYYNQAFERGTVQGGEQGLRQTGWVRMHADRNNDGKIQDNEKLGWRDKDGVLAGSDWQIQFHRGGSGDKVGETSAGCQAIKSGDYARFQQMLADAPDSQKYFNDTLTDSSKLPPPGFEVGDKKAWNELDITQRQSQARGSGMLANIMQQINPNAQGRGVLNSEEQGWQTNAATDVKFHEKDADDGHGIIVTPHSGWRSFGWWKR